MSLEFCSPEKIPSEIKFYDKKILQMDVGKTGKIGYLKIDLKHDLQKNKTIIKQIIPPDKKECIKIFELLSPYNFLLL